MPGGNDPEPAAQDQSRGERGPVERLPRQFDRVGEAACWLLTSVPSCEEPVHCHGASSWDMSGA